MTAARNPALYRPCVGIALLNNAQEIFMGRRLDRRAEAWQMPQGGIDAGETPEQALWREMREEIGTDKATIRHEVPDWLYYDLPPTLQRMLWGGRYRGQRQKWFILNFTGSNTDINIATAEPEFIDWQWVKPAKVLEMIVPFKKDVYSVVLAHIAAHAD